MTKKKLKLKKKIKRKLIILLFIIIISIVGIKSYKTYKYHQTYEYKLLEKNYTKEETDLLLEKLDKTRIEKLLTTEKNEKLINYINRYFPQCTTWVKALQADIINQGSAKKFYERTAAIFALKNMCGWSDNNKDAQAVTAPIQININVV